MLFLVTEVTKGMWAKKQAKMKRNSVSESPQKSNQIKERISDKSAKNSEPLDNKVVNLYQNFGFCCFYFQ
jgi:hypothetical protein